jgi:hypothetical protein
MGRWSGDRPLGILARMALSRRRLLLFSLALLVAALTALEVVTGGQAGLLYVGPVLLLCAPLVAGRYVGEERLLALANRYAADPPRRGSRVAVPRTRRRVMPRGGRLVASSLAERPPPRAAVGLIA